MVEKIRLQRPVRYPKDVKPKEQPILPQVSADHPKYYRVPVPSNPSFSANAPSMVTNPNYLCEEHKKECSGYVPSLRKFVCPKCTNSNFLIQGKLVKIIKERNAEVSKKKVRELVTKLQEKLKANYNKMIEAIDNSNQTSKINSYFDDHQNDLQNLKSQMTDKGVSSNEFDTIFNLKSNEEFSSKIGSNVAPTLQFAQTLQNPSEAIDKAKSYFNVRGY
jgi:hypothetical protein